MSISTAVDASAVARVVGIKTAFADLRAGNVAFLPQRIAVIGQGSTASTYATTKRQVTSAYEAASLYGFGSPIHLAVLQLLPINGDGVGTIPVTVYPLDDDGSGVASAASITPSGTQTIAAEYVVKAGGVSSRPFTIAAAQTVAATITAMTAAINAVLEMPIIATDGTTVLTLASKWKGVSANNIYIEVVGSTTAGTAFAVVQPTGGLVNPSVSAALAQIGNVWETLVLNCLDIADTTTLGLYSAFGEGRWGALVRKPLVVFTGNTEAVLATAISVSDARTTDRVNCQLVAPGSHDLPCIVAARQLARIAVLANNNPPHDYGSQQATGLTPGLDSEQWLYADRDTAVKGGSSTIQVKDGVVCISDVVTFYHPTGDPAPAYRYVVDIIKLQNIIFNIDLIFNTAAWDGAPLIPDGEPTINPAAKKPSTAITAVCAKLDGLGLWAIISDVKTAKAGVQAGINSLNPKRLDVAVTVQLSGNTNIVSADLNFGFYFG